MRRPNTAALRIMGEVVLNAMTTANIDMEQNTACKDSYRRDLLRIANLALKELSNDPDPIFAEPAKAALEPIIHLGW